MGNKNTVAYLLYFALFLTLSYNGFAQNSDKYKLKTLVIDAGHGGKDPGALGKISQEKNIALAIALKLGYYIEKNIPEVNVIYTRKTDVFVTLDKRAEIANSNNADLFISIHVDAIKNKSFSGTSTYIMGLHRTDDNLELAKKENSVILLEDNYTSKYEGYDPNSPESHIIFSLVVNTFQSQSLLLASKIQDQFRARAGRKDHGVKQAGLVVLWNTTMPSVLIETGYITNRNEEKFLNSEYGQDIIASAIFRAFREYKQLVESKTGLSVVNTSKNNNDKNTDETQITFKIQIKSSNKPIAIKSENFKGLNNIEEMKQSGSYKYLVGNETSLSEILKTQSVVRKKFPDAFVVAFKNGKRIPYDQAIKELGD